MKMYLRTFGALFLCALSLGLLMIVPVRDLNAEPLVHFQNFEKNPGINLMSEHHDIIFGEEAPKPRFSINGVEMIEGVDFEYRYGIFVDSGSSTVYQDYRKVMKSGFYTVYAWFSNHDALAQLHKNDSVYDACEELDYFYVYPTDINNCTYDADTEIQYQNGTAKIPRLRSLYLGDFEMSYGSFNCTYLSSSDNYNQTIRVEPNNNNTAFTGTLDIPIKYIPEQITQDNTQLVIRNTPVYSGYKNSLDINVIVNGTKLSYYSYC